MPRHNNWRSLDEAQKNSPHQLPRIESSLSCPQVICAAAGQCDSHCFYQQNGRHSLNLPFRSGSGDMEMVPREADNYPCRASPRSGEYSSRLAVATLDRFERLEAPPRNLPEPRGQIWSLYNRSIRFKNQSSTTNVLQLETRPSSCGSRWTLNSLERPLPLHVPTICSHLLLLSETGERRGSGTTDSTSLAEPGLVPPDTEGSDQLPDLVTTNSGDHHQPRRPSSSNEDGRPPAPSRMACVRRSCSAEKLSDRVINIIRSSWRQSTEAAYSSAWKLWACWCAERHIDPFSAPLKEILKFLSDQFEMGKQYRMINSIQSAISMTLEEIDGSRIGQHPLVSRFLKGVFNQRPPTPKYGATWDVDIVLQYFRTMPKNEDLSFQTLSHKLAMLLALANADRCSDLAALDLDYVRPQINGIKFIIPGLTKTRRSGPPLEAFYPYFTEEPQLCPVKTFEHYQERSQKLRTSKQGTRNPLFVSVRKPYKPVKAATIGHWLKKVMKDAGVDTEVFSAHSTRGASTSKARSVGVATADILKAANWSSASTFCRFYCRPVTNGHFGLGVLKSRTQDTW